MLRLRDPRTLRPLALALSSALLLAAPAVEAQSRRAPPPKPRQPPLSSQVEALKKQLADQQEVLDNMRKALGEQDERYKQLQQAMEEQKRAQEAAVAAQKAREEELQKQSQAAQQGQQAGPVTPETPRTVQIGTAPTETQAAVIPQLFEQPGVLTPPGKFVLEPSIQYGYSSSNRAALIGYTIVPAVLIGLIDVREVRRNTLTAALTGRVGLTNRSEVELKVPYVRRWDSTVSREIFQGSATDRVFDADGSHLGDVEVTGRYQLTDGGGKLPYLIGSLRFKSRTGRDPFEVTTDCVTRCVANTTGTGQPLDLPTGSGFYTLQPGITWLYPSDPAVFFGSFTYAYNFKRKDVSRTVLGGEREFLGDVRLGNTFGFNVGMGLALNDRSSFSMGVDVSTIGRTKINGRVLEGSARTTLASLVLGYSHVWDKYRTVNLSVAAGLTRDTPDLTLTLRVPFTF